MSLLLMASPSLSPGEAQATVFTIEAGQHYSSPRVGRLFSGRRMDLTFKFDSSAFYQFSEDAEADQGDVNKLYGFSDCVSSHLQNSARLGWRDRGGKIEILAFTHKEGEFRSVPILRVEPNRLYRGSISLSRDSKSYLYEVEGTTVTMERGCESRKAHGTHLQPYFGGNQAAPHRVQIEVDAGDGLAPVLASSPFPNPMTGLRFSMKVRAFESIGFFVRLYSPILQLVWESPRERLAADFDGVVSYRVDGPVGSGTYLLMPYGITSDGAVLPAAVSSPTSFEGYRLLIP